MSDVAFFYHFYEVENRENFDPKVSVSPKNFKKLLGEYKFDEDAICQVYGEKGHCGQKHKNGWLGVTDDNKEILIGGHCAKKYFKADSSFKEEKRRIRKELNIKTYTKKIQEILSDRDKFQKRFDLTYRKAKSLKRQYEKFDSEMSPAILGNIKMMEKTQNRKIEIEVKYVEVDENNKKHVDWVRQTIGNVRKASFVDYRNIGNLFRGLKSVKAALNSASEGLNVSEKKLKTWSDSLSSFDLIEQNADELLHECISFTEEANVALLIFTTSDRKIQENCAEYILKSKVNKEYSVSEYINFVYEKVKKDFSNREIRVAI